MGRVQWAWGSEAGMRGSGVAREVEEHRTPRKRVLVHHRDHDDSRVSHIKLIYIDFLARYNNNVVAAAS